MPNKYKFYEDKKGEFRWVKKAPNGKTIGSASEGFKSKTNVIKNAQNNGHTGNGKRGWT